ncbi:MAG: hypothetical protein IJ370_06045 [Oscillospiraceae bacterium]|nr:hypothetical protein [Oscillospiraceae bacterium]
MNNLNNNLNNGVNLNKAQGPKAVATQKYTYARHNLLLMIGFTVINIVLLLLSSDTMFLFSATVPYMSAIYAQQFALVSAELPLKELLVIVFSSVAVVSLVAYFLCWLFSKKHYGWMIVALVLFSLDTLAMAGLYLAFGDFSGIADALVHVWVLYYLILGVINGHKLRKMPEDPQEMLAEPAYDTQDANQPS